MERDWFAHYEDETLDDSETDLLDGGGGGGGGAGRPDARFPRLLSDQTCPIDEQEKTESAEQEEHSIPVPWDMRGKDLF